MARVTVTLLTANGKGVDCAILTRENSTGSTCEPFEFHHTNAFNGSQVLHTTELKKIVATSICVVNFAPRE